MRFDINNYVSIEKYDYGYVIIVDYIDRDTKVHVFLHATRIEVKIEITRNIVTIRNEHHGVIIESKTTHIFINKEAKRRYKIISANIERILKKVNKR